MGCFNVKNRILGKGKLYMHLYREWIEEGVAPEHQYSHLWTTSEVKLPTERFYIENNIDVNKPIII